MYPQAKRNGWEHTGLLQISFGITLVMDNRAFNARDDLIRILDNFRCWHHLMLSLLLNQDIYHTCGQTRFLRSRAVNE